MEALTVHQGRLHSFDLALVSCTSPYDDGHLPDLQTLMDYSLSVRLEPSAKSRTQMYFGIFQHFYSKQQLFIHVYPHLLTAAYVFVAVRRG